MLEAATLPSDSIILRGLRRNRLLVSLIALHFLAALATSAVLGKPFDVGVLQTLNMLFRALIPIFLLVLLVWRFANVAAFIRPDEPLKWFVNDLRMVLIDGDRIVDGAIALLSTCVFFGSFSFFKGVLPDINPFSWDPLFAQMDRALHGGYDPYTLLMPIFGHPYVLTAINGAYHFWMVLVLFMLFVACFTKHDPKARDTFMVSYVLIWALGGNLLGTVFASGGPVYYAGLGYGDDFAPLISALQSANQISPIPALEVHELLWKGYIGEGPAHGISAMPSMHLASSALLTLYGFRISRWLGWALVAFTATMLLGSVLLAWHYAIDGYLGILLAIAVWAGVTRLFPSPPKAAA